LPFFANFYSTTAIVMKRFNFFVATAALHGCPSAPFSSSGHPVCRIYP
jgi:hypothetical protein